MAGDAETRDLAGSDDTRDRDVVIVGGGPAGCSAAVFTARHGLDTVVFDRGNSSLRRCAYLENYLGFPGGVDVETFYDLMHAHVEVAGGEVVRDLVETVTRTADGTGFVVETLDGRASTAGRVVAATRYGGEYLRPLGGTSMFVVYDHDGEEGEHVDPDYADVDGRTPVEGLYVAAPAGESNAQAIVSAGHGARVTRSLLEDYRRDQGYPEGVARHWDWLRRDAERRGEWRDRDRWREWFDERTPDDQDASEDGLRTLRENEVDRRLQTYLSAGAVSSRSDRGLRTLVETIGVEAVLSSIDDDRIREYVAETESPLPDHG